MPASSSSSGGGPTFAVDLYDANFVRQATVDVPAPPAQPAIIQFRGLFYAWNFRQMAYTMAQPYVPQGDLGAPRLSVLSNPQPA